MDRIFYICSNCIDNNPEGSGFLRRQDLGVMPDGRWLCESCLEEEDERPLSNPPEYVPKVES